LLGHFPWSLYTFVKLTLIVLIWFHTLEVKSLLLIWAAHCFDYCFFISFEIELSFIHSQKFCTLTMGNIAVASSLPALIFMILVKSKNLQEQISVQAWIND